MEDRNHQDSQVLRKVIEITVLNTKRTYKPNSCNGTALCELLSHLAKKGRVPKDFLFMSPTDDMKTSSFSSSSDTASTTPDQIESNHTRPRTSSSSISSVHSSNQLASSVISECGEDADPIIATTDTGVCSPSSLSPDYSSSSTSSSLSSLDIAVKQECNDTDPVIDIITAPDQAVNTVTSEYQETDPVIAVATVAFIA